MTFLETLLGRRDIISPIPGGDKIIHTPASQWLSDRKSQASSFINDLGRRMFPSDVIRGETSLEDRQRQHEESQRLVDERAADVEVQQPQAQTQAQQQKVPQVLSATDTGDSYSREWEQTGRLGTNPYSNVLTQVFGELAPQAEQILRWGNPLGGSYGVNYGGENFDFNPLAENKNSDGSIDRGLFQINSNTFSDFMRRKGDVLRSLGITSYEDMYDPTLNATMAKLIFDEQGWGAWYGKPPHL